MGDLLQREGLMKPKLLDREQRCYAAVVVLDGNSLPDRLPYQLAYGIPLVFIRNEGRLDPPTNEFWYDELQNGTNFLTATVDTLEATLERLPKLPDRGAEIGRNSAAFTRDRLSEDRLMCYATKALTMYGERYAAALRRQSESTENLV